MAEKVLASAYAAKAAFRRGYLQTTIKVNSRRLQWFHAEGQRWGKLQGGDTAKLGAAFGVSISNYEMANRDGAITDDPDDVIDDADLEELGNTADDAELDEADQDEADDDEADQDEADDDESDEDR